MLNFRLAAMLVLLACVVSPLTFYWVTSPSGSWLRPYIAWLLVIIATWLWQRRRFQRGTRMPANRPGRNRQDRNVQPNSNAL